MDVTHATDCPVIDQTEFGRVKIGKGPVIVRGPNVNPVVFEMLTEVARDKQIPHQVAALGSPASNDGAAIQVTRGGVATGLVTRPNRYMHSPVELAAESDLDHAARLIAAFCLAINSRTNFTPQRQ